MAHNISLEHNGCINLDHERPAVLQRQPDILDANGINHRGAGHLPGGMSGALNGWAVRRHNDVDLLPVEHDVEFVSPLNSSNVSDVTSVTGSETSLHDQSFSDVSFSGQNTPPNQESPPSLVSSPDVNVLLHEDYVPVNIQNALTDPYEGVLDAEIPRARPYITVEELWINTHLGSNIDDYQVAHLKFRQACAQMHLLDTRIRETRLRIGRAERNSNRACSYSLQQHISVWVGVKIMFYEYACRLADEMDTLEGENAGLRARLVQIIG